MGTKNQSQPPSSVQEGFPTWLSFRPMYRVGGKIRVVNWEGRPNTGECSSSLKSKVIGREFWKRRKKN